MNAGAPQPGVTNNVGGANATTPAGRGGPAVDRLYTAITGQESGGNFNAVNPHSGALGVGQVMPANVRAWTREAAQAGVIDREYSPEEFRARPDIQERVVKFKLEQYFNEGMQRYGNEETAVRYAAAKWYSGRGENMNSTRPQYSGGQQYPSIAHYSDQVLERFRNS